MEEKIDLINKIIIFILSMMVLMLTIKTNNLKDEIDRLEKQSEKVHEYILNRIGG